MLNREQQILAAQCKEVLELLPLLQQLENQLIESFPDPTVAVNTAYVCRKSSEMLDEMRKKIDKVGEKCEAMVCLILQKIEESRFATDYCVVSPNPSVYIKYPQSPRDEGFEEFVKQLPPTALRPHYPTIKEIVTQAVANCEKIPFGLKPEDTKSIEPKLRITSRKEL